MLVHERKPCCQFLRLCGHLSFGALNASFLTEPRRALNIYMPDTPNTHDRPSELAPFPLPPEKRTTSPLLPSPHVRIRYAHGCPLMAGGRAPQSGAAARASISSRQRTSQAPALSPHFDNHQSLCL